MRLKVLEEGKGLRPIQKLLAFSLKKMNGNFMPPPVIVGSYKKELFGKPFAVSEQESLRGCIFWSKAEAELMAAFVAKKNACRF